MATRLLHSPENSTLGGRGVHIYIYTHTCTHTHTHTHICIYIYNKPIGIMVWVFINGPEDLGEIPCRVILKTQKMVLDASLLNTQHYKVWIKANWSNSGKGGVPSLTPQWCSSWKGSLHVSLDYSWPTYFIYIYIYI